jgi:hypothetical protein
MLMLSGIPSLKRLNKVSCPRFLSNILFLRIIGQKLLLPFLSLQEIEAASEFQQAAV